MKKLLLSLGLICCCSTVFAEDIAGAGVMHIQIANDTTSICKIVGHPQPIHGMIESSPPYSIMPGDSKTFDVAQTFRGIDIDFTYQCGGKHVTLHQDQPWVIFIGKSPTTSVVRNDGLDVSVTVFPGYQLFGRPAQVNWVFKDKPTSNIS